MFLKYSSGQIPPKKSRGRGSQGKKTANTPLVDVDVSEESDPEPARKRHGSKRVVKKKVIISADDNIIPDPDVHLELCKSISLNEAEEEEAARQIRATHARFVTESVPESARRRPSGIAIKDTPQVSKKVSFDPSQKLKGTEGLGKGTANIPRVHDESTVISATSSEGTGTEPGVLNREEIYSEEDDENKDDTDDDRSIDIENTNDKETEDELLQGVEQANDDEDEEMKNVEVEDSRKGDAKISDVAKA
nr:hypothetical protein [Tanacetum cinerariifolium]